MFRLRFDMLFKCIDARLNEVDASIKEELYKSLNRTNSSRTTLV